VAIKRHEFHPKSRVALATTLFEADRSSVSASASPSLLAPLRGTTACSAFAADAPAAVAVNIAESRSSVPPFVVARSVHAAVLRRARDVVAFTTTATSSHNMSCVFRARSAQVTRFAWSATAAASAVQTPDYACLLEAV
jgi:hypothetical protein